MYLLTFKYRKLSNPQSQGTLDTELSSLGGTFTNKTDTLYESGDIWEEWEDKSEMLSTLMRDIITSRLIDHN